MIYYYNFCLVSDSLAAKVARQDSLAKLLSNRPNRQNLIERNIIHYKTEEERLADRKIIGNKLNRYKINNLIKNLLL